MGVSKRRAVTTAQGLYLMAEAVHGRVDPEAALRRMDDLVDLTLETIRDAAQNESGSTPWIRSHNRRMQSARKHVFASQSGPDLYRSLQKYEQVFRNTLADLVIKEGVWEEEEVACRFPIGFEAKAETFLLIDPGQISILLLAARPTADIETWTRECELRFLPDDLCVIGYMPGVP